MSIIHQQDLSDIALEETALRNEQEEQQDDENWFEEFMQDRE
jgi:hypothetical protein